MEKGVRIADLFRNEHRYVGQRALVQGWVRTKRDSKAGISFIELSDGSCLKSLQVIAELDGRDYSELLSKITTGSAILAEGTVSASPGKGQSIELRAERILLYGWADPALYPLQKKRHSFEYLRQIAHLRPRTNTIGAAARVRSRLSYAIHQFFQDLGFYYIHTPIITASNCEGAGEIFRVTTLDPAHPGDTVSERPISERLFRKACLSHRERSASGRNLCSGPRESIYLRSHLQSGEFQYQPTSCRVLDGGAGNGFLRP